MTPLSKRLLPLAALIAGLVLTTTVRAEPPEVEYDETVARVKQPVEAEFERGLLTGVSLALVDDRLTPLCRNVFQMPPGMYVDEQLVFQPGPDGRIHSVVLAGMVLRRIGP